MTDREELEAQAKRVISSELYWDLLDNLDSITDDQLRSIIGWFDKKPRQSAE